MYNTLQCIYNYYIRKQYIVSVYNDELSNHDVFIVSEIDIVN